MEMIRVGKAAKMLGVSIKTLQNWDKKGFLIARRTPTNYRYYTMEQLRIFIDEKKGFSKSEI